jgi:hypothetical protein
VAGSCEHINIPPGSTVGGKFLEQLNDYQLLKLKSVPCTKQGSELVCSLTKHIVK